MNQEINNLDQGGDRNAMVQPAEPNLAVQRIQAPEVVAQDPERLQQQLALFADRRHFRLIDVGGDILRDMRAQMEQQMQAEEAKSAAQAQND